MLCSFGRYQSNGSASYDRAIYLTLWNAVLDYFRDLKSGRTYITNPRFSMCILSHPHTLIRLLLSDKAANDDGLLHRFLSIAPQPPNIRSQERIDCKDPLVNLVVIFLVLETMHSDPKNYTLQTETTSFISQQLNYYQDLAIEFNCFDPFIA